MPLALPLLAGLFALVASGALTGQSLTRAAPFPTVPMAVYAGDHAVSTPGHTPIATTAALQPPGPREDDTPWGFFREHVKRADSLGKWLSLIVFTIALTYFYIPRLLIGSVVVVGVLALIKPQVRHSRLVRSGLVLVLLGFVALAVGSRFTDNPVGAGLLLSFTTPLGAMMMVLGAMQVFLEGAMKKTDKRLNRDIAALVASAESSRPVWPDEPALPEVDLVATHGSRAGSALVMLLGADLDDPSGTSARSVHVEQQAELALCKIYRVLPTAGETVRDARSSPQETNHVSGFWRRMVSGSPSG